MCVCMCVYVCVCMCVWGEGGGGGPRRSGEIWCHVICRPLAWRGDGTSGVRTDSSGVGHAGKELKL